VIAGLEQEEGKMAEKARLCKCGCGRKLGEDAKTDFLMPSHEKRLQDSRKDKFATPMRKGARRR
jgi:hypothetical protein